MKQKQVAKKKQQKRKVKKIKKKFLINQKQFQLKNIQKDEGKEIKSSPQKKIEYFNVDVKVTM